MKQLFRKIHRWLGLLMALQIVAWMASGLYFAWFPIETIRGEHLTVGPGPLTAAHLDGLMAPDQAWRTVAAGQAVAVEPRQVSLVVREEEPWYRITAVAAGESAPFTRMVHARSGLEAPFLEAAQASRLAEAALRVPGTVRSVELLETVAPGAEYRGRDLPVWRVSFAEPESLNLYIDGWTGEVVARRTARWRIFDFLWMLHIMDFETRDDFNTPLLQVAAALGLLVALTGVVFWAMTTRLLRRRRMAGLPQS
ncbi:MAG: peptidase M4 [Xanthomonadales bacterium]|nr:peptidase M4 [Xanthomonadales bacterium]NIN60696.1 peptidase M4 [Xanthomonadales bacterium]NIN76058.1 peptidase M4 [Xanthomonadales bacterium]NIO14366.1 peptidase M4 [Xanthomonadales bacterium]NIP13089.1 peptidase M4 [Xanthomonadales bacterium]